MQKKLHLTIKERSYLLRLSSTSSGYLLETEDDSEHASAFEFEAEQDHDSLTIHSNDRPIRFTYVRTADGVWLSHKGRTWFGKLGGPGFSQPSANVQNELRAPMTGTLTTVHVEDGDSVEARQLLAVIDAMKMEYRLEAPVSGKVRVSCGPPGSSIQVGSLLFRVDPDS